jgi:hypothetical protein
MGMPTGTADHAIQAIAACAADVLGKGKVLPEIARCTGDLPGCRVDQDHLR